MTKIVIALTSVRGRSGKDTLIDELRKAGHQVTRVAFGDTLKEACADEMGNYTEGWYTPATLLEFFHSDHKDFQMEDLRVTALPPSPYKNWLLNQAQDAEWLQMPRTPRWHLQMYGTEYRREFLKNPNVWLDAGLKEIQEAPEGLVVVTDMRQQNEYAALTRFSVDRPAAWAVRLHRMWFVPGVDDAGYHKTDLDLIGNSMSAVVLNEWGNPSGMVDQLTKQIGGFPNGM